jgi:hypothetical protein
MHPIQYYSCFISYSHQDNEFVHRLHADLQNQGVRCWFAPHDMRIGDKIRPRIDEAIRLHDKLLLILSKHSAFSDWVEHEVETALAKERREKRPLLFSIRLDNAILEHSYIDWLGGNGAKRAPHRRFYPMERSRCLPTRLRASPARSQSRVSPNIPDGMISNSSLVFSDRPLCFT